MKCEILAKNQRNEERDIYLRDKSSIAIKKIDLTYTPRLLPSYVNVVYCNLDSAVITYSIPSPRSLREIDEEIKSALGMNSDFNRINIIIDSCFRSIIEKEFYYIYRVIEIDNKLGLSIINDKNVAEDTDG
jgi:hypothetical protein